MQILNDFSLSDIVYYRIGGTAKTVLKIQNKKDVEDAIVYLKKNPSKILVIGLGSNILLPDSVFSGVVLWFCTAKRSSIQLKKENLIEVFASATLDDVIQFSFRHGLIGLEWAGGLPSTVGGAVRGNIGAFGGEIKDSIESVEVIDLNNFSAKRLTRDQLKFSYRGSKIKEDKNLLVISVNFLLQKATFQQILIAKKTYREHIKYRKIHHAVDYPSCGSVFKNIINPDQVRTVIEKWNDVESLSTTKWHGKIAMGYIIRRLGLSGYAYGGAQISEKHANYIVNKNNARYNDVIEIIKKIKNTFYNDFGFYPEEEVEISS